MVAPVHAAPANSSVIHRSTTPPPPPDLFVGRAAALDKIANAIGRGRRVLLSGPGGAVGIGRTALALQFAHLMQDTFPDGVLYSHGDPFDPYWMSLRFARGMGLDASELAPAGEAGRVLDKLLAGRRSLIVLDDVKDSRLLQLIPPIGPAVIATCRDDSFAESLDAEVVTVEPFTQAEADLLVQKSLGMERWKLEPKAAQSVSALLSYHPLAIRLAIGPLIEQGTTSGPVLAFLTRNLSNRLARLQRFSGESRWAGAAFACALERLSDEEKNFLLALGALPNTGHSLEASAVVAQIATPEAAKYRARLIRLSFARDFGNERFALLPLVADLARGLGAIEDCRARAANYYLGWALTHTDAPEQLDDEIEGILAGMAFVTEKGDAHRVRDYALALGPYFDLRGYKEEVPRRLQWGLAAARAGQDPRAEGRINRWLGRMFRRRNAIEAARERLEAAKKLAIDCGDVPGRVSALLDLGRLDRGQGRMESAIKNFTQTVKLAGARLSEKGEALLELSEVLEELGRHEEALERIRECLAWAKKRKNDAIESLARVIFERLASRVKEPPAPEEVKEVVQQLDEAAREPTRPTNPVEEPLPASPDEIEEPAELEPPESMREVVESKAPELATAALQEESSKGDAEHQVDALEALASVHLKRGNPTAAEHSLVEGAELAEKSGDPSRAAGLLEQGGKLLISHGDISGALTRYEKCFRLREAAGDKGAAAKTLHKMGRVATDAGDYDGAMYHFLRGLDREEALSDETGRAEALFRLGVIFAARGDYDDALAHYEVSEELWLEAKNLQGLAAVLLAKGRIQVHLGHVAEGTQLYQRSLELASALGDGRLKASALHQMGLLAVDTGDYKQGLLHYRRSLGLKRNVGDLQGMAVTLHAMARLEVAQGRGAEARTHYERVLEIASGLGANRVTAATYRALGDVAAGDGDFAVGRRAYEEAARLQATLGEKREIAAINHGLGTVCAEEGNFDGARKFLEYSLRLSRELQDRRGTADTLYQLGIVFAEEGMDYEATEKLEESLKLDEGLGNLRGTAVTKAMLGQVLVLVGHKARARTVFREALDVMENLEMAEAETVRNWLEEGF